LLANRENERPHEVETATDMYAYRENAVPISHQRFISWAITPPALFNGTPYRKFDPYPPHHGVFLNPLRGEIEVHRATSGKLVHLLTAMALTSKWAPRSSGPEPTNARAG
jgi:hypothetical protein